MAPWIIRTGFGLDDWIYLRLLSSLLVCLLLRLTWFMSMNHERQMTKDEWIRSYLHGHLNSGQYHRKCLLNVCLHGNFGWVFVYTETYFVSRWSLGIYLHGNVFFTELFPRNGLNITVCWKQTMTWWSTWQSDSNAPYNIVTDLVNALPGNSSVNRV
jgi:hypothetical protein